MKSKVVGLPAQVTPFKVKNGVAVIVAVWGDVLLFHALNEGSIFVPLAGRPIPGMLFCHS